MKSILRYLLPCLLLAVVSSVATNANAPQWLGLQELEDLELGEVRTVEFFWSNQTGADTVFRRVQPSGPSLRLIEHPWRVPAGEDARFLVSVQPDHCGPYDAGLFVDFSEGPFAEGVFSFSGIVRHAESLSGRDPIAGDSGFAARHSVEPWELMDVDGTSVVGVTIVDTRSEESYLSGSIPGSLNLALHTVKARRFLKRRRLVLVNEGHDVRPLLQAARELTGLGFVDVAILRGGVAWWQQQGGVIHPKDVGVRTISPGQFRFARDGATWKTIHIEERTPGAGAHPLEGGAWIAHTGENAVFTSRVEAELGEDQEQAVLIVCRDGSTYGAVGEWARQFSSAPVYFLEGGRDAYADYLVLVLMSQTQRQFTVTTEGPEHIVGTHRSPSVARRCCP